MLKILQLSIIVEIIINYVGFPGWRTRSVCAYMAQKRILRIAQKNSMDLIPLN